jgi:hypothetical protein
MTDAELSEYYTNLLILQYKTKEKAFSSVYETISAMIIYELLRAVENGYDIDTAIGHQQDILGKYLGVARTITGAAFTKSYFWMLNYADSPPIAGREPMPDYNTASDALFRRYGEESESIYSLSDEQYRIMQRLGVIRNSSNNSIRETDELLTQYFGSDFKFVDNYDMTITYTFPADQAINASIAVSLGLIPKAMGVQANIVFE